jgi:hypothetical protein
VKQFFSGRILANAGTFTWAHRFSLQV